MRHIDYIDTELFTLGHFDSEPTLFNTSDKPSWMSDMEWENWLHDNFEEPTDF